MSSNLIVIVLMVGYFILSKMKGVKKFLLALSSYSLVKTEVPKHILLGYIGAIPALMYLTCKFLNMKTFALSVLLWWKMLLDKPRIRQTWICVSFTLKKFHSFFLYFSFFFFLFLNACLRWNQIWIHYLAKHRWRTLNRCKRHLNLWSKAHKCPYTQLLQ